MHSCYVSRLDSEKTVHSVPHHNRRHKLKFTSGLQMSTTLVDSQVTLLTIFALVDWSVNHSIDRTLNTDYLMLQTCQNFNVMNKTCQKKSIVVVKLDLKLD